MSRLSAVFNSTTIEPNKSLPKAFDPALLENDVLFPRDDI